MPGFHISPRTKKSAQCRAKEVADCPYRDESSHFDTRDLADAYIARQAQEEFSELPSHSKGKKDDRIRLTNLLLDYGSDEELSFWEFVGKAQEAGFEHQQTLNLIDSNQSHMFKGDHESYLISGYEDYWSSNTTLFPHILPIEKSFTMQDEVTQTSADAMPLDVVESLKNFSQDMRNAGKTHSSVISTHLPDDGIDEHRLNTYAFPTNESFPHPVRGESYYVFSLEPEGDSSFLDAPPPVSVGVHLSDSPDNMQNGRKAEKAVGFYDTHLKKGFVLVYDYESEGWAGDPLLNLKTGKVSDGTLQVLEGTGERVVKQYWKKAADGDADAE